MTYSIDSFTFPANPWYESEPLEINFPPDWEVTFYKMKGSEAPTLPNSSIEESIASPIGSPNIKQGAQGKNSAVILVDDLTRPTPAYQIIPYVLEQLMESGIPKDSIRFIVAQGAHRAHTRHDYRKKLGDRVLDNYPVFSHNPFYDCVKVGTTSFGTPVEINQEVMNCEYKIGIGGLVPHPMMGFGGGGKIIHPGVASMESIRKNHYLSIDPQGETQPEAGWGKYGKNKQRLDVEEACRMAGLDFKIDAMFNCKGQITHIFAGDPVKAHREGVKSAKLHYSTPKAEGADLVVAGSHCKSSEAGLAVQQTSELLQESGDLVIAVNSPQGLAPHYLYGRWGKSKVGGHDWTENKELPEYIDKIVVFTPYVDRGQSWWFGPPEKVEWVQNWDKVLNSIGRSKKQVALYPDATIQLFE